jgi:hypothetical protein
MRMIKHKKRIPLSKICIGIFGFFLIVWFKYSYVLMTMMNASTGITDSEFNNDNTVTNSNDMIMMSPNSFLNPDNYKTLLQSSSQQEPYKEYEYPFPCINQSTSTSISTSTNNNSNNSNGITFVKVHKCASTTVRNIMFKIAKRRGNCQIRGQHAIANTLNLTNPKRDKSQSYLFTFIREPTKRAISDFYYHKVTRNNVEPTFANFKNGIKNKSRMKNFKIRGLGGYQLQYIQIHPGTNTTSSSTSTSQEEQSTPLLPEYTFYNEQQYTTKIQNPKLLYQTVENTINDYDFVGVADRVGESLVVLSFLLDLTVTEISNVNSRMSGSYADIVLDTATSNDGDDSIEEGKCVKIVKPNITPEMQKYIDSDEWKASIAGDILLHKLVNDKLDYTITNVIGKDRFDKRLQKYISLNKHLELCGKYCSRCSLEGEFRSKVPRACGVCIDMIRKKWKRSESQS